MFIGLIETQRNVRFMEIDLCINRVLHRLIICVWAMCGKNFHTTFPFQPNTIHILNNKRRIKYMFSWLSLRIGKISTLFMCMYYNIQFVYLLRHSNCGFPYGSWNSVSASIVRQTMMVCEQAINNVYKFVFYIKF